VISVLPIFRGKPSGKIIILVKDRSLPMVTHQRNAAKQCTIKLPSYLISGLEMNIGKNGLEKNCAIHSSSAATAAGMEKLF